MNAGSAGVDDHDVRRRGKGAGSGKGGGIQVTWVRMEGSSCGGKGRTWGTAGGSGTRANWTADRCKTQGRSTHSTTAFCCHAGQGQGVRNEAGGCLCAGLAPAGVGNMKQHGGQAAGSEREREAERADALKARSQQGSGVGGFVRAEGDLS